jgi:hypothetical protein
MAWPTASEIQQRTGIALTTGVTAYGLNVTDMITNALSEAAAYCNRERYGFDEVEVTETFDGLGILQVSHPPIMSVTSLTWDGTALSEANEEFFVYDRYIKIPGDDKTYLMSFEPEVISEKIAVLVYKGGYSDTAGATHRAIPKELSDIIREMIVRELLRIDERYRVMKGVQNYSLSTAKATFTPDNGLLSDLYTRLARGGWEVTTIA